MCFGSELKNNAVFLAPNQTQPQRNHFTNSCAKLQTSWSSCLNSVCVCWGNVLQSKLYNLSVSWRLGSVFFFLLRGRLLRHERCLIWLLLLSFCPEWSIYGLATCVRSQPTVSVGPSCGLCFSALSDATRNFWYELTFSLLAPNRVLQGGWVVASFHRLLDFCREIDSVGKECLRWSPKITLLYVLWSINTVIKARIQILKNLICNCRTKCASPSRLVRVE